MQYSITVSVCFHEMLMLLLFVEFNSLEIIFTAGEYWILFYSFSMIL